MRAKKQLQATLEDRIIGAYLGLAVGDALGATTEFMTPNEIKHQFGLHRSIIGGGWLGLKPGQVTDDTEMTLALGQSIITHKGINAKAVAEAFSDWMRTKPVDIGNTVRRGIIHFRTTGDPVIAENHYDAGNGACMRCLPIAIYYRNASEKMLHQASRIQSHVTHNSPVADAGTETLLNMLVAAFKDKSKDTLKQFTNHLIECYPAYQFNIRKIENPSGWIIETLQVVFQTFFAYDNFEAILIDIVNRGGDSDTTGAIAGMLAGAFYGQQAIPIYWLRALDVTIKNACTTQAIDLLALSQRELESKLPVM